MNLAAKSKTWKRVEGESLPDSFLNFINEKDVFKYGGSWCDAYYKGDIDNPEDVIIITDNGGFYKVDAEFMVWSTTFVKAYWSTNQMMVTIKEFIKGDGTIPRTDKNYQT